MRLILCFRKIIFSCEIFCRRGFTEQSVLSFIRFGNLSSACAFYHLETLQTPVLRVFLSKNGKKFSRHEILIQQHSGKLFNTCYYVTESTRTRRRMLMFIFIEPKLWRRSFLGNVRPPARRETKRRKRKFTNSGFPVN